MITNQISDFSGYDFTAGESLLVDKPYRWTSFKVVHHIRKAFEVKKVGHAGTLDPLATGLLILCTGKKTKAITSFQDLPKTYTGTILLGKRTASMDLETPVIEEKDTSHLKDSDVLSIKKEFEGNILQIPPMYSAIKHNGKNLYLLARKGKEIERKPRELVIDEFNITEINLPEVKFEIKCSKGTYIRVIANDLGEKLGCGGVLTELRRTRIGEYDVKDALKMNLFVSYI